MKTKNIFICFILLFMYSCNHISRNDQIIIKRGFDDYNVNTSKISLENKNIITKVYFNNEDISIIKASREKYIFTEEILKELLLDCTSTKVNNDTIYIEQYFEIYNESKFNKDFFNENTFKPSTNNLLIVYKKKDNESIYYILDTTITINYNFDFSKIISD